MFLGWSHSKNNSKTVPKGRKEAEKKGYEVQLQQLSLRSLYIFYTDPFFSKKN